MKRITVLFILGAVLSGALMAQGSSQSKAEDAKKAWGQLTPQQKAEAKALFKAHIRPALETLAKQQKEAMQKPVPLALLPITGHRVLYNPKAGPVEDAPPQPKRPQPQEGEPRQ
jgi:hypothetical protein